MAFPLGVKIPFSTRMAVVRLADGGLWCHSPIDPAPELFAQIDALGEIRHLVSPNKIHYAHISAWQARYPQALVWASAGVRERAAAQGIAIAFDDDINSPISSNPELSAHLQKAVQRGAHITALCYGTYALAYAGLLDGRTAATHWLAEDDFVRRFPKIHLDTNRLYVEDDNFLTSAGAAGGLDCCLYLIRKIHGATVANDLARTLVAAPHREGGQAQFIHRPVERRTADDKINHLLDELRQNLATPYRLDDLAKKLAVSRRTFIRHFSQATGMNFGEWFTTERLWQAQDLLENTDLPIERIAEQSGFGSAANLRLQFKAKFKINPNAWRKVFGR